MAIAALLVLASLLGAAQASAATYHAYLCRIPYGPNAAQPASTDNTAYTSNGPNTSAKQTCATGGSMSATVSGTASHTAGQGAAVLFDAPAAMTIAGFRLWRHEAVGQSSGGSPFTKATYGSTLVEPDCSSGLGCRGRGDPSAPLSAANEVAVSNLREITQVRWNAFCGGAAGATLRPEPRRRALRRLQRVRSRHAPRRPGGAGRRLGRRTAAGGRHPYRRAVRLADRHRRRQRRAEGRAGVDGAIAGEQTLDTSGGGGCADLGVAPDRRPSYADTQPCPASVSGLVTLNTDALTPGRHSLSVLVADATGNTTLAHSGAITVVGSVPVGSPNGAPASRGAKLTARFGTRGRRVRRLGYETRPTISGRLVNEAGAPIAGAAVDILVRDARSGARRRDHDPGARVGRLADVRHRKTRKDGRYRWTHRFRSRSLVGRTVAIRARADSPIYPFAPGTSRVVRVRFR